jgi:RNA polymerase sigma-70 factor (ECF subfamily)
MTMSYREDSGVRLMLAYQEGDESAFDRLVEEYSGRVFALVTRFMGNHPGREDLVQDVFLRVVRARERYQPTASFSTYLYRIVFNLCVNETQRGGGRNMVSIDASMPGGDENGKRPDFEDVKLDGPSQELEREDVVRMVREAIASLPEGQRMALILAKYHEMPYVEIAQVMDSTEKAIKSLIHRGRERLRTILAPLLEEEIA